MTAEVDAELVALVRDVGSNAITDALIAFAVEVYGPERAVAKVREHVLARTLRYEAEAAS